MLAGAGVAFVVLTLLLVLVLRPLAIRFAKTTMDRELIEVSEVIGRQVTVSSLTSGLTEDIVLEGVVVPAKEGGRATLRIERVHLDFSLWDAVMGRRLPHRIQVDGFEAFILLEEGHPEDLLDLYRGVRRLRERKGSEKPATGRRALVRRFLASGNVQILHGGTGAVKASLVALSLEGRWEAGSGLETTWSGRVRGLSDQEAVLSGTASVSATEGHRFVLESDRPIDPRPLMGNSLPVAMTLSGLSVEQEPAEGTISVTVDNPEVPGALVVPAASAPGRLVTELVSITADRARAVLDPPGADLSGMDGSPVGPFGGIESFSIWNAALTALARDERLGELTFRNVNLSSARDRTSGETQITVDGEIGSGSVGWARTEAKIRLGFEGTVREVNGTLSGQALVGFLSRLHPRLLPWAGASMGLKIVVKGDGKRYGIVGRLDGRGLNYFWTKLCLVPVTGLDIGVDFTAMVDVPEETISLHLDPIAMGPARFALNADIQRFSAKPKVKVRFSIPKQRCEDVAAAIPPVLVPRLEGARFDGWMNLDVVAQVDFRKVDKASLKINGDLDECRALSLGPLVKVDRLNTRWFEHQVREEDLDQPIRLGPATRSWVPLEDIPVPVQHAALATEDMLFFEHFGFQVGLIRRAVRLNLDHGWYVYGGSTISQQLVKNLFLSREKTLARKLEEAVIVWVMEGKLEKERILELYLNCIEFGKHIYGIRAAAREYYDKEPPELSALEGAFIMATKPKPRYAHKVYRKRVFNDWWVKRMKGILDRLHDPMEIIDYRTTVTPDPCPPGGPRGKYLVPCFHYADEGLFTQPAVSPDTEIPPGMPRELPKGEGPVPPPGPEED